MYLKIHIKQYNMYYKDIELLYGISQLLNMIVLISWLWSNRYLVRNIFIELGFCMVNNILYLKSHLDIKYTLYVQPFIEKHVKYIFELFESSKKEYNPEDMVNIILFFKNQEIIELKEKWDDVINNKLYNNNDKEVEYAIIEKYDKKSNKYNGIIYENYDDYLSVIKKETELREPCDIDFMTINVTINEDNNYLIDLCEPINYYMIGNNILQPWFIRYYLKKTYNCEINIDIDNYGVYVMDQNINEIIFDKNKFIRLVKTNYILNNITDEINSPSEDSE